VVAAFAFATTSPAEEIDFNRDIRPILSNRCFACHGPDSGSRKAELRLDVEEQAKADRGGYTAVAPKKPDDSELFRRITSKDADAQMPPPESGKPLKPAEIRLLKQWISEGAKWSLPWAYVEPKLQKVPTVQRVDWPRNPIDSFVLARLEAQGLQPSPAADKITQARRLYIDLIGLPPTPKDVDAFVADDRPDAYEKLVDRLLASPHFGERMASYWLDLVRYADTVGYHGDQEQHISPYRDYVINAFNSNMRFDQFTREQLAGDLLERPTTDQKIASGYNRLLQTSHEGGVQPKEYLAIYAADHVRNFSAVWLGGTMGCAQCHDHKFDPYKTRDFYSMAAFFADVDEAQHLTRGLDISPTIRAPELELPSAAEEHKLKELAELQKQLEVMVAEAKHRNDFDAVKSATLQLSECKAEQQHVHNSVRKTMITVAIEPRVTRVLPRGNWMDDSGEIVQPAIPEFLGKLDVGGRRPTRLDLANWLIDSRQGIGGLTARVMSNRFWYLLFNRGIAAKLDDFGGQGEAPDNPQLLDYLAKEFVTSGWDVKHMLRLIATSQAYRQSSMESEALREKDPFNKLVARQARFRYPAESVRDSALVISGLFVPAVGGESVRPYQPAGYYRHLNFPLREYVADTDDRQWRRGVYMHWQRQYLHPMLKAFDAPSREECTAQRACSNTAPAALVLLNDPTFVEAARAFAGRTLSEGGSTDQDRLTFAVRQATSREIEATERRLLDDLLQQSRRYYEEHTAAADKLLKIGNSPVSSAMDKRELASWTIVARTLLNMSEVVTRQ